jgi:hypothetical protein
MFVIPTPSEAEGEESAFSRPIPTIPVLKPSVKFIRHTLPLRKTPAFCGKLKKRKAKRKAECARATGEIATSPSSHDESQQ